MRKQKGFTLIELVVVVMILGILAAVAAPKLLNTSGTAADQGLKQTLGVVRDAIERYAAEHSGSVPADPATLVTLGYLRGNAFPVCPVAGNTNAIRFVATSTAMAGNDDGTHSWVYCTGDGTFICNSHADSKIDQNVKYDAF
jgi:prepilin-type N-terminal cleavage/methylation domain-containing protein